MDPRAHRPRARPRRIPQRPLPGQFLALLAVAAFLTPSLAVPFAAASTVSFTLFTTTGGWGLTSTSVTSPGPTLTVNEGDLVQLSLTGADNAWHNFFVDYNGNDKEDPGQGEPVSPDFRTTTVSYSFTADVAGTFKYVCGYHSKLAYGTIIIIPAPAANTPPTVALTSPGGASSWTGGSVHAITWNMSDTADPSSALVAYLNYTSSAGGGAIAGPLPGGPNPRTFLWTLPFLNVPDLRVNLTVIDTQGLHGYDDELVPTVDSSAPTVVSTVPANGTAGADVAPTLHVNFSEEMNRAATEAALSLFDVEAGSTVALSTLGWTANSLLFQPLAPLRNDSTYEVRVGAGALDRSDPGNAMAPFTFSFRTHNNPPSASVLSPDGTTRWTGGSTQSVAWSAADLEDPLANLSVEFLYSPNGTLPWVSVVGPLSGDASPAAWVVPADDTSAARLELVVADGSGLSSTVLSPAFAIDSTAPSVQGVYPANGSATAVRNTRIFIAWSESMNAGATAVPTTVGLLDVNASQWVAGTFRWSSQEDVLVLAPLTALAANTLYSVWINVTALDGSDPGNAMASAVQTSFVTSSAMDAQPPALANLTVSPAVPGPREPVVVAVEASDDTRVGEVWANVTGPLGQPVANISLRTADGTHWTGSVTSGFLGAHTVAVWACDVAGNCVAASGSFQAADVTPPAIAGLLCEPAAVNVPSSVRLSANVTDESGIGAVWIFVDGANLTAVLDTGTGRYAAMHSVVAAGPHNYTVWARDGAGLLSSASGTFTAVDSIPPMIVAATVQPPSQELGAPTAFDVEVTDAQGVAAVWIAVEGQPNLTLSRSPSSGSYGGALAASAVGTYLFAVWAEDASGNRASLPGSFEVVDTTPPTVAHTAVASWPRGLELRVNATAADLGSVAGVWFQVNGTGGRSTNLSAETTDGIHFTAVLPAQTLSGNLTYAVAAVDASGNWNVTRTFTVAIPADAVPEKQEDPALLTGVLFTVAVVGAPLAILAIALARRRAKARAKAASEGAAPAGESPPTDKRIRVAMQALLGVAAAGGVFLLLADAHLWETAPDHAFALVAFTALNVGLAGALATRWSHATRLASLWAAAQCAIMMADVATAPQYNLTYTQFAAYLFGQAAFVAILAAQAAVFILGSHRLGGIWATVIPRKAKPAHE